LATRKRKKLPSIEEVRVPTFSVNLETGKSTALICGSDYDRMIAVVDAARSGNSLLLRLALDFYDHGELSAE
jgi:hypothetical protein